MNKKRIDPIPTDRNVLDWLGVSPSDLTLIVRENPSLRGMILGYVAEFHLKKLFVGIDGITNIGKDDDHDRKLKGDLRFTYRGRIFRIESKSLQTNSIKTDGNSKYTASYQCDASDSRKVKFSDGSEVETTALRVGEFDILAVCMFPITNKWDFAFCRNDDLRRSENKEYTDLQRSELLSMSNKISWPIHSPYSTNVFSIMDGIIENKPGVSEVKTTKNRELELQFFE